MLSQFWTKLKCVKIMEKLKVPILILGIVEISG